MWPTEGEKKAWLLTSIQQGRRATGPLGHRGLQRGWTIWTWKTREGQLRAREAPASALSPSVALAGQGGPVDPSNTSWSQRLDQISTSPPPGFSPKTLAHRAATRKSTGLVRKRKLSLMSGVQVRSSVEGMAGVISDECLLQSLKWGGRTGFATQAYTDQPRGPVSPEQRRGLIRLRLWHSVKRRRCHMGAHGNNQIPSGFPTLQKHAQAYKAAPG